MRYERIKDMGTRLTRNFEDTVKERLSNDPLFEQALLSEASDMLINGEDVGLIEMVLRHINHHSAIFDK